MATAPTIATNDRAPALGIVVVNYRTPALTIECLAALEIDRAAFRSLKVVAVDGGSADGSAGQIADAIAGNDWEEWISPLPLAVNGGFAFANNRGIELLCAGPDRPDFICLINPDARVLPGALAALARLLEREPAAGAAGALLVHEDGTPQGSAFHWPSLRGEFAGAAHTRLIDRLVGARGPTVEASQAEPVDWVTGAAVMFRTDALADAGLFDEGFFLYYEETELMHRLAIRGWTIWHEPAARVVHHAGAATNLRDPATGRSLAKRMPLYWYQARCRYFALTGGRLKTLLSAMAYASGRAIWLLRCWLTGRTDTAPPHSTRDTLAYSLWPSAAQRTPQIRRLGEPLPETPAWMTPL